MRRGPAVRGAAVAAGFFGRGEAARGAAIAAGFLRRAGGRVGGGRPRRRPNLKLICQTKGGGRGRWTSAVHQKSPLVVQRRGPRRLKIQENYNDRD